MGDTTEPRTSERPSGIIAGVKLEDLQATAAVRGILSDALVTVVSARWFGADALELTCRGAGGELGSEILYRDDEARLEMVEQGRPWSFDGDGELFRLVSEALRIHLAHLFDSTLAVHTSLVEPLPHQITAVYEAMLPRQPLRFLLADDPGAGKTIMTGLLMKELIARGDLQRCLVVCPGSLAEQWQDELYQRFHLNFEIFTNDKAAAARTGNWFLESKAQEHAVTHIVPEHLQEIRSARLNLLAKTEAAVKDRLTKEIAFWDHRASQLRDQELAGSPCAKLNSGEARRRADTLQARLQQRLRELQLEAQLAPLPPVVLGGVLVVPQGLLAAIRGERPAPPNDVRDTQESAARARAVIMDTERALGFEPTDRETEHLGYDIEPRPRHRQVALRQGPRPRRRHHHRHPQRDSLLAQQARRLSLGHRRIPRRRRPPCAPPSPTLPPRTRLRRQQRQLLLQGPPRPLRAAVLRSCPTSRRTCRTEPTTYPVPITDNRVISVRSRALEMHR